MTKILTPASDLDIAVLNVPEIEPPIKSLHMIADKIKMKRMASYIEVIESAKVPIVKFDHINGISVDICCNNSSGITTGKIVKKYSRKFPPLKYLTVVLKIFLVRTFLHFNYIIY